jgi:hypothetical protein
MTAKDWKKFVTFSYKAHMFCVKLQNSKPLIAKAFGGMLQNILMGYVYLKVVQEGSQFCQPQKSASTVTP